MCYLWLGEGNIADAEPVAGIVGVGGDFSYQKNNERTTRLSDLEDKL